MKSAAKDDVAELFAKKQFPSVLGEDEWFGLEKTDLPEETLGVPSVGGPSKTIDAPGQLRSTTSLGTQAPTPNGVEDYVETTQTPRKDKKLKTRTTIQQQEKQHGLGNPVYQSTQARNAQLHKNQEFLNQIGAYETQIRAGNAELYAAQDGVTEELTYAQGLINAGKNVFDETWNMVTNPGQTIIKTVHGLFVLHQASNNLAEDALVAGAYTMSGQSVPSEVVGRFNERGEWIVDSWGTMANMTGPQWVQFGAETALGGVLGGGTSLAARGSIRLINKMPDGSILSETAVPLEAANHVNLLRLQKDLEYNSIFDATGKLTSEAIQNSRPLRLDLKNSTLVEELSQRPGNLSDWYKYESPPINTKSSSTTGLARMHFYHNPVTGDVYYDRDYKAIFDHQGNWERLKPTQAPAFSPDPFNMNPK